MKRLRLSQFGNAICLSIGDKRTIRFWMTAEGAQHLANRLQSFASGQRGGETILHEISDL